MKFIKRLLKLLAGILVLIIIGGTIFLYNSGPTLAPETDKILSAIIDNPLPEIINGETGIAQSQEVAIWYESQMPKETSKGAVFLIMGISNDALGWPPNFISKLINAGYQVVRYDHRGTGLSDWMTDWDAQNPYSLADMAMDGLAVLDVLQIEKAHIIGVSMGGMIAQEMVIHHPNRVLSLTSIMSSGNILDEELPPISTTTAIELIKVAAKYSIIGGEKNTIKLHLASRMILMGAAQQELDIKEIATHVLYNIQKRRGFNPYVSTQHQGAVLASKSRYAALKNLTIPTLVIHGKPDPFIPFEHGQKLAAIIPNSDSLWLDNMGHDIPNALMDTLAQKIIDNFNRAKD